MTDWRRVTSLTARTCDDCGHLWLHTTAAGITHRFCRSPAVLEALKRRYVAASIAWDDACGGKQWLRRARTAQERAE